MEEEKNIVRLGHDDLMAETHEELVARVMELQDEAIAIQQAAHEKQMNFARAQLSLESYQKWYNELKVKYDNCLSALLAVVK